MRRNEIKNTWANKIKHILNKKWAEFDITKKRKNLVQTPAGQYSGHKANKQTVESPDR